MANAIVAYMPAIYSKKAIKKATYLQSICVPFLFASNTLASIWHYYEEASPNNLL
jgi:hypothetical protein